MANMSANILRNLVAEIFDISATKVVLSGEISPNYSITNYENVSYVNDEKSTSLYGFNPREGFKSIPEVVTTVSYYNGNHDHSTENGCDLHEVANIKDYIFFVEIQEGYNSEGTFKHVTLYKSPDFSTYIEKLEQADIARWEQWLSE